MCTRKVSMLLLSFGIVVLITLAGANSTVAQEEGLILYLPFDEGSGDTVADLSDTGLDGTIHGNAEWVEGIKGEAINLDGETAYVNLPASDVLHEAGEEVSFSLWFNATEVPGDVPWQKLAILIGRGNNGDFALLLFSGCVKTWIFTVDENYLEFPDGAQAGKCVPELAVEADRWYHVVFTYEDPIAKFYLNGELAQEGEAGGAIRYIDDNWTQFGGFRGSMQFFNGAIDEIRIYNRALTPEEIAQMSSIQFAVSSRGKLGATWGRIKEQ